MKSVCRPALIRQLVIQAARVRLSKQAITTPPLSPAAPALTVPSAAGSNLHKALCYVAVCVHKDVDDKEKKAALEAWLKLMPEVQLECGVKVRLCLSLMTIAKFEVCRCYALCSQLRRVIAKEKLTRRRQRRVARPRQQLLLQRQRERKGRRLWWKSQLSSKPRQKLRQRRTG